MSIAAECDQLEAIPLLRNLDPAKRKLIAMSSDNLTYTNGDAVFRQGEAADAVYFLLSGSVRVFKDTETHALELAHLKEPAVIGETGVICGRTRNASVIATSETRMLRIDSRVFIELLEQVPDFSVALVRELAARVEATNQRLLDQHSQS
ncbi:MAG: cyclic nucleotide-binding domain-containing protein [Pseudomonadota bacterium]